MRLRSHRVKNSRYGNLLSKYVVIMTFILNPLMYNYLVIVKAKVTYEELIYHYYISINAI
jgi:hypothetical protein